MASTPRETYLENVDRHLAPLVRALDRAIVGRRADLQVAIRYRMLMYSHEGDFTYWICAIDARKQTVCLRFLQGSRLVAPPGTLRPGSTTMGTIDFRSLEQVDTRLIADLVSQAVAVTGEIKASRPKRRRQLAASPPG